MEVGGVVQTDVAVRRVEIDGVPVFWSDSPGPRRISLVFRTGRADETLAGAGLTHLVEHLALFAAGADLRRHGGFVDHFRTVFFSAGSDSELCDFAARLVAALTSLPLERAEEEKRVLLTEAASAAHGSWKRLMGLRFGAQSFGLVDFEELGLRRPGTTELAEWCRQRFVLGNLAVWMTGPPPDDLRFALRDGGRSDLPTLEQLPGLELPAHVTSGGGGVVASFVGRRSVALTVALALLQQRLHEGLRVRRALSYSVAGNYVPLSAEWAHLIIGADCLDEHAAHVRDELVAELKRLSTDGPESRELSGLTDAITASWAEEQALVLSDLDMAVTNELLGAPQTPREQLREEYRDLTPATVIDALGEILPTTLLAAPTGTGLPDDFSRYRSGPAVRLEGTAT